MALTHLIVAALEVVAARSWRVEGGAFALPRLARK
jgi:hypothetical protein